ncbi:MAG: DNA repair protein RecN [Flavobacterium sp.]|nr:DNA repair protein RecN [Pedobacter sp.]
MLNRLIIRNYALIDNLDISFSKDLNILTGETGAGKSIMMGALSLLLGQRAESKYFYNQDKKCIIEGIFSVQTLNIEELFQQNDLDYDAETVLRREISSDGKSRSFVNDTPVNLTVLRQLGEKLIDIHSQHAILEINDKDFQLNVLDIVAGHTILLTTYQKFFKLHQKASNKLNTLLKESEQLKADQNYFQFQYDELESAGLISDEQENLEKELNTLTHAEEIKSNLIQISYLINGTDNSVISQLKEAISCLQNAEKFNQYLNELTGRLKSSLIEIKDVATETEYIEQQTGVNEIRKSEIIARLNIIYTLQKKHRVNTIPELLTFQESIFEKLNSILFTEESIANLTIELTSLKTEMQFRADEISENRRIVIPKLEKQIQEILQELGMPQAVIKINQIKLNEDQLGVSGYDQVQYLFSANKGQQPLPMNRVASGGELSRLMLSIKSLIAKHASLPTLIFDEIDSGISGEVALKVGHIMESLSGNMQIIAITHLPQIASKGHSHYWIYKDESSERTLSNIKILDKEERTLEIAKMLSGENPGEFAIQNARELLNR